MRLTGGMGISLHRPFVGGGSPTPPPTPTPAPAPAFTTQPSISDDGTPTVGETLTGNDGAITNGTVSARQWLLNGSAISGATGGSYVPTQAGDHAYRVTATGAGGTTTATSAARTVAAAPTPGGTSPTRYSFAGAGYRAPTTPRSVGTTNLFHVAQFLYSSPAYETNNLRFFMPNFHGTTANEIPNTTSLIIEAIGIDVGGTVYSQTTGGDIVNSDGTTTRSTFPITIPAGAAGVLLDPIGVTVPADAIYKVRVAYNAPSSGNVPTQIKSPTVGHGSQGGTTTQAALVSAANYNTNLSNTNTHSDLYAPLFAVAQGGDGREALIVIGDSIGYGQNDSTVTVQFSTRGAYGFLERGLDDNSGAKRIASANLAVPGQGPQSWGTASYWNLKRRAVQAVNTLCGAWPFDRIVSEHGTNSITVSPFDAMMQAYWTTLKAELGNKPLTQTGLLPLAATSDSYASLGGQTASGQNAIGANRWNFNAALAANGYAAWVDNWFEPWRKVSYDDASNRDKLRVTGMGDLTFAATLAAAFAGGATTGSVSLTAAPSVGMGLMFTGSAVAALVTSVSGSGPYTVGLTSISGNLPALASGSAAREVLHDGAGLHPTPFTHKNRLAAAVVEWKQSLGWI